MKIRSDFVTNSSSSSFVIAKTSECTLKEIEDVLRSLSKEINSCLAEFCEDSRPTYEEFIMRLAEYLYDLPTPFQLGEWSTTAMSYSDDDGGPDEYFLYNYGHKIVSEHFKIGGRSW